MVVAMLSGFPATGTGIRDMAPRRLEVDIEGRTVSLSNLDKLMYPRAGFTKGHVIDSYTRIAPFLLQQQHVHKLMQKNPRRWSRDGTGR